MPIEAAGPADAASTSDIQRIFDPTLVVTGFFTPDYAALATKLGNNLSDYQISHHFYARQKIEGGWKSQTRQKPTAVLAAMRDYPSSALVLMDVDCLVKGKLAELTNASGDIALRLKVKATKFGRALMPCARIILIKPTAGARRFVDAWESACAESETDELALIKVINDSAASFSIAALPRLYVGEELRDASPDMIVLHDSAHDPVRLGWGFRKSLQKHFRAARDAGFRAVTGQNYGGRSRI